MALRGLRFAGMEARSLAASKAMWLVAAAIAIIPLLYGALYLAAFQDPYSRISSLPVAVVNQDEGAVIAGERRVLGDDVVSELEQTTDGLQWHFVSADQALRGLKDGTYFMTCTIPEDFSAAAASVDTDAPRRAQLTVRYDESENMLASQIGLTVWKEVRLRISNAIANEYWTTVLARIAETGTELEAAADGAGELSQGLVRAQDGSLELVNGLGSLTVGAASLASGLGSLAAGSSELESDIASAASGTSELASGTGQLASGLGELRQQTSDLPASTQSLASGVERAVAALKGIAAGIGADGATGSTTLMGGLNGVQAGLGQVSADASTLSASLQALGTGIGSVETGVTSLNAVANEGLAALADPDLPATDKYAAAERALSAIAASTAQGSELTSGLSQARVGVDEAAVAAQGIADATGASSALQGGVTQVREALADVRDSINASSQELDALQQGAAELAASSGTLTSAISELSSGATQVNGGAQTLASGTGQLVSGAASLARGAASALSGADELESGAATLQEGGTSLADGLTSAIEGSDELGEKLASGAREARSQASNASEKAQVMSSPVTLDNQYYTRVENYGTGFAPYFMALGIWVGCLVAGFVFKPLNGRLILSGASPVTAAFANYLPMASFAVLQAALLMLVIQFGLHLQIDNVPGFYAVGFLTALVYAAVMQLLGVAFGFSGRFVAIILLMLQLTSSAGTFPIQTAPAFFQAVSPFLPMTYVVEALRQVTAGLDYSLAAFDALVLTGFGAACFALTALVAWKKRLVTMEGLHPLINLG